MTSSASVTTGRLLEPIDFSDHVRGPERAAVTLVEYGDYQCPYCAAAHPVVQDLLHRRPTTVRFVYRHFPLTEAHPYAEAASEAAEAAGARQRFWPMHDWLYANQEMLDPDYLTVGAERIGIPGEVVEGEISGHLHLERVRRDFIGGIRSGVEGTPTFFVNGYRHDGGSTLPELLAAVDAAGAAAA